jgi:hypothetical protein
LGMRWARVWVTLRVGVTWMNALVLLRTVSKLTTSAIS